MPLDLSDRLQAVVGAAYRVEVEIPGGGMSRLFLARDLALNRDVVVKVLPPELLASDSLARFRREVELTALLQHPYILPIITAGGDADLLFYISPFIRGESLKSRLASQPALSFDEAGRLISELLGAVAFAHARGVIHRDIKPANVLISEGHAMLADFGIARALANPDDAQQTQSGTATGTPVYMAPERPRDEHADLYAVAVMAFEAFAVAAPPTDKSPAGISAALMSTPARANGPRTKRVARVLAKAMAPDPSKRYNTARAFREDLELAVRASTPLNRVRTAIGVTIIAALAIFGTREWTRRRDAAALNADLGRIVVAPLQNFTGIDSLGVIGVMAGDWITEGLQKTAIVEVVPTTSALQASRVAAHDSGSTQQLMSPQILAEETGAVTIVYGAMYRVRSQLEFRVTVADRRGGRVVGTVTNVSAPLDDPVRGVEELRSRVMGWLAVRYDERLQSPATASDRPPTYDSYRAFSEGMTKYVAVENAGAAPLFMRAYKMDSSFTLALFYAAISLTNQAQWEVADSLLRIIDRKRSSLSGYNRAWLDYRLAINHGDPEGALKAIRIAARQAPESKSSYNYAVAALQSGHLNEALLAADSLHGDHGAMRGYPPYWTVRTEILHALGQYDRERVVGDSARHAYPGRMMAIAQFVRALAAEGRLSETAAAVDEARRLPTDSYHWDFGGVLIEAAVELQAHGHGDAATGYYMKARDWLSENQKESRAPWELVEALYALHDWPAAEARIAALASTDSLNLDYIGMRGLIRARRGDRAGALHADSLLAAARNQPFRAGLASLYRARIQTVLGDRQAAIAALRQSFDEGRYWHLWIHRDVDLQSLRGVAAYDQLVRGKD